MVEERSDDTTGIDEQNVGIPEGCKRAFMAWRRGLAGIPSGCVPPSNRIRWYRCAQPPANGLEPFGFRLSHDRCLRHRTSQGLLSKSFLGPSSVGCTASCGRGSRPAHTTTAVQREIAVQRVDRLTTIFDAPVRHTVLRHVRAPEKSSEGFLPAYFLQSERTS